MNPQPFSEAAAVEPRRPAWGWVLFGVSFFLAPFCWHMAILSGGGGGEYVGSILAIILWPIGALYAGFWLAWGLKAIRNNTGLRVLLALVFTGLFGAVQFIIAFAGCLVLVSSGAVH